MGVCTALIGTIYHNIGERIEAHEKQDDERFKEMKHELDVKHHENLTEFRRVSRAQLIMVMAMISDDPQAKEKLVEAVKELLG